MGFKQDGFQSHFARGKCDFGSWEHNAIIEKVSSCGCVIFACYFNWRDRHGMIWDGPLGAMEAPRQVRRQRACNQAALPQFCPTAYPWTSTSNTAGRDDFPGPSSASTLTKSKLDASKNCCTRPLTLAQLLRVTKGRSYKTHPASCYHSVLAKPAGDR